MSALPGVSTARTAQAGQITLKDNPAGRQSVPESRPERYALTSSMSVLHGIWCLEVQRAPYQLCQGRGQLGVVGLRSARQSLMAGSFGHPGEGARGDVRGQFAPDEAVALALPDHDREP